MTRREIHSVVLQLHSTERWCKDCEAQTRGGAPCCYDDRRAAAWSLDGALFRVLGKQRAMLVMPDLAMQLGIPPHEFLYRRDPAVHALTAIVNWNDHPDTTFGDVRHKLYRLREN